MNFPINVSLNVEAHRDEFLRSVTLYSGLTVLLGPNGSGKTHLLRSFKRPLQEHTGRKKVRFLSAGRMGPLESYRSDYDGQRGGINYEGASHGRKAELGYRHSSESLNGDFQTLAERADILIKVQERLRKLFKRDILIEWDAGQLKVSFARLNIEPRPYSSGREASGLLHLVGMLSAIYDDDVGALLIDEPEVSLHPQLQSFLLTELLSCAGLPQNQKKLIIIATHSTEFIRINKPEDLSSIVFSYDVAAPPIQIDPDAGELKGKSIRSLVARLGQEHKLALFSKRPLLVEGPSDAIIVSGLANKINAHLEAAGSQILPVVGKGQLHVVAKLMRLMGKQPVVLADADGIADGTELLNAFLSQNPEADAKANGLGAKSASALFQSVYNDFCELINNEWEEIREVSEKHYYWINNNDVLNLDKAKRRSSFCSLFQNESDKFFKKYNLKNWINIRDRFKVVLNLAENFGLFFLRKGTIESYYNKADSLTSVGKPSEATIEMEWINEVEYKKLIFEYDDIFRCIKFAADSEEIREVEALRDILLAVAAPAQAKLYGGTTSEALQIMSRGILGDRSRIFELVVEGDLLVIKLKSQILDVDGFPIKIKMDDNVNAVVAEALKI